jgi:hypothetical protein
MKYKVLIPKTSGDLRGYINNVMLSAPKRQFLQYEDFDVAFYSLQRGVKNLRKKMGDVKAERVLDMLAQAKTLYETGDNKLGGALMEDTKMVVIGRQPWAYPKELYRWPVNPLLPELSEADLLNKGDEEN